MGWVYTLGGSFQVRVNEASAVTPFEDSMAGLGLKGCPSECCNLYQL